MARANFARHELAGFCSADRKRIYDVCVDGVNRIEAPITRVIVNIKNRLYRHQLAEKRDDEGFFEKCMQASAPYIEGSLASFAAKTAMSCLF